MAMNLVVASSCTTILELHEVDQEVEKMKQNRSRDSNNPSGSVVDSEILSDLWRVDTMVGAVSANNTAFASTTETVPTAVPTEYENDSPMRSFDSVTVEKEEGLSSEVYDLLSTDMEVDGGKVNEKSRMALTPAMVNTTADDTTTNSTNEQMDLAQVSALLSNDIEVDGNKKEKVGKGKNVLDELYQVDQEVDNATGNSEIATPSTTYYTDGDKELSQISALLSTDLKIDGQKLNEKSLQALAMAVANEDASTNKICKDEDFAQISALLSTDLEVDGHKKEEKSKNVLNELYQVDQEVDNATGKNKVQEPLIEATPSMEELTNLRRRQLAQILAKEQEHAKEYRALLSKELLAENNIDDNQHRTTNPQASTDVAELYATDLSMDECADMLKKKDEVKAIVDLYNTDRQVDKAKEPRNTYGVLEELWKIDQVVDGKPVKSSADFVDNMAENYLRQKLNDASSLVHNSDGVVEVWNLLQTDIEIDSKKEGLGITKDILPLLQVDKEVDGANGKIPHEKKTTSAVPLTGLDYSKARREGEIAKVKNLRLPNNIASLYSTDLEVDGCSAYILQQEDTNTITELHEMDLTIDQAKARPTVSVHGNESQKFENIMKDLYQIDQTVDGHVSDDRVEFADPLHKQIIREHQVQTQALVHRFEGVADVSDLFYTDLQVDGLSLQHNDIDCLKQLYDVDRDIDRLKMSSQWKRNMSDMQDFLSMDNEIDSLKAEQQNDSGIISQANSSMADLYAVDMTVEGRSDTDARKIYHDSDASFDHTKNISKELLQNQINGLSVEELLMTDREIEGAKSKVRPTAHTAKNISQNVQENGGRGRSIFSTKEKDAAQRHNYEATRMVQTLIPGTEVNKIHKETPQKRSIFSARERDAAVKKGQHWL